MENRGATGDVEHSKFYRITEEDNKVIFNWGPTGAEGQQKVALVSDDAAERTAVFDKQLKSKQKGGYVVVTQGGEPGQFIGQTRRVEERPSSEGRRWGLEVETHSNVDINRVAQLMTERGLRVNVETGRYFKSQGDVWDVKRDGSCGYEFASPILSGEAGFFDAKVAVEKIREICPSAVNHNCGIHVTIDVRDHSEADLRRLCVGYLKAQEHFFAECAEWRQNNRYCLRNCNGRVSSAIRQMIDQPRLSDVLATMSADNRYQGLNLARLREKKIVEFRMMESSVAIRKVGGWIRMCVGFIDGLKASGVTFKSPDLFSAETFKEICEGTWRTA